MRILIAGQTYHPAFNGQSIFTINLAEGLARKGHEVWVVKPSDRGDAYHTERNGVQIQAVKAVSLSFLHPDMFYTLFPGREIRRIFRTVQPDIVHIHDHYPISRAVLKVARRFGVKVVGTNHFMPENVAPYIHGLYRFKTAADWALWRWVLELYNQLDVATAPSRTAAGIIRRQGLRVPVYSISCGVDLDRFHPNPALDRGAFRQRYGLDPDKITLLFVGRVDGEKRLDVLLNALKQLDRQDIQLAIAGIGAARVGLENMARELGLSDRVTFTGFVPDEDLPALLNAADIFAMPSEAELLSIASLEAMASAKPLLAARSRALPELVTEGSNGYLFQPGNAADAAHRIAMLVEQRAEWSQMGAASLEKVQVHSLDNTLQGYEKIYEAVSSEATLPVLASLTRSRSRRMSRRSVRESIGNMSH